MSCTSCPILYSEYGAKIGQDFLDSYGPYLDGRVGYGPDDPDLFPPAGRRGGHQ